MEGFDFGYLIKMLVCSPLPDDDSGFYKVLNAYFPTYFDVKYLIHDLESIKMGGLSKLAADLHVHIAWLRSILTVLR